MYAEEMSTPHCESTKRTSRNSVTSDADLAVLEESCSSPPFSPCALHIPVTASALSPASTTSATTTAAAATVAVVRGVAPVKRKSCAKKHEGLNEEEIERKRLRNNELERVRQQALQSALRSLGHVVPDDMATSRHKPASKIYTLENAMTYISNLAHLIACHDLQVTGRADPRHLMLANFACDRGQDHDGFEDDLEMCGNYSASGYASRQLNFDNNQFLGERDPYSSLTLGTTPKMHYNTLHESEESDIDRPVIRGAHYYNSKETQLDNDDFNVFCSRLNKEPELLIASGHRERLTPPNFLEEACHQKQESDFNIQRRLPDSSPLWNVPRPDVTSDRRSLIQMKRGGHSMHDSREHVSPRPHSTPLSQLHSRISALLAKETPIAVPEMNSSTESGYESFVAPYLSGPSTSTATAQLSPAYDTSGLGSNFITPASLVGSGVSKCNSCSVSPGSCSRDTGTSGESRDLAIPGGVSRLTRSMTASSSFSPERLGLTLRELVESTPLHKATAQRRRIDFHNS